MDSKSFIFCLMAYSFQMPSHAQQVFTNIDSLIKIGLRIDFEVDYIDSSYSFSDSCTKYLYLDSSQRVRKSVTLKSDGTIRRIANYDEIDKIHGLGLEIHPNGLLKSLSLYVHGVGVSYHFYEGGQLEEWYMAADGRAIGRRQQFYSNGALLNDATFDGSHWLEKGYYEDGTLEHRGKSDEGQPIGVWEYFNSRGRRIR